jgi:hypothetical protein
MCGPGALDAGLADFGIRASFHTGPDPAWEGGFRPAEAGELLLYLLATSSSGASTPVTTAARVSAQLVGTGIQEVELRPGCMLLVPGGNRYSLRVMWPAGAVAMSVLCSV